MLPLAHMGITIAFVRSVERVLRIEKIDYRLLLVASILPDLLDKSLGYILSAAHSLGTRSFGHSLFFLLLILSLGVVQWYKHKKTHFLLLFIGSIIHDALDRMWYYPRTLFWPWGNNLIDKFETWEISIRFGMLHTTQLIALEFIGGSILLYGFIWLLIKNRLFQFVKSGHHQTRT